MFLGFKRILEPYFVEKMSESYKINTTQNVRLSFEVASIGDRMAAGIIDLLALVGYSTLLNFLMSLDILPNETGYQYVYALPAILYHLLFETLNNGRSIGKMIMKTRVMRTDGTEPRLGDYILRWLIGMFEIVASFGIIAIFAYLFNGKGQRLGDMAAGTTVVKLKQKVTLEQTIFEETNDGYVPTYHNANILTDAEIEAIKEVVDTFTKTYSVETLTLISKTKFVIEQRLNVKAQGSDKDFLMLVVRDFNHLTGRIE